MRTRYDLDMLREVGYCNGVENYSRHLAGREPGSTPWCLLGLLPQRLAAVRRRVARHDPAGARDVRRRPLAQGIARRARFPSAVRARQPAADVRGIRRSTSTRSSTCRRRRRRTRCARIAQVVEMIIRPTGLVDPEVEVRPTRHQVDDLMDEIRKRTRKRRARPRHDADEEDGGGPHRLSARERPQRALPAQRSRNARTHRDPARSAQGRVRRAGRHQSPARGARPARGLARRHPRCG